MPDLLVMRRSQLNTIAEQIRVNWPLEICGFLAGAGGRVEHAYPIVNVAAQPQRTFRMDSQQQIKVLLDIEKNSHDLLAIYHSHPPFTSSKLSTDDYELFQNYSNIYQIIVMPGWNGYIASIRAFYLTGKTIRETPLKIQK